MKKSLIQPAVAIVALLIAALFCVSCDLNQSATSEFQVCDHNYSAWETVDEPTCTEKGKKARICSICDKKQEKTIPLIGHTEVIDPAVEPTCTQNGLTEGSHCSVCNKILVAQQHIATITHNFVESVRTPASCVQNGVKEFVCDQCSFTYTEEILFPSYSADQIYEQAKNAVGEIITYDKTGNEIALGTGFVYSADGKIVTNYHVIEDAYSARITLNGQEYDVALILAYDKDIDLAILQIHATDLPTLPLCTNEHAVGKPAYAFGSSRGMTATFSQGIITHAFREIDGVTYVQHDAAISGGNSGGPLINQHGEVIGINTWTIRDSQNLNFAILVKELDNLSYDTPMTFREFYEKESNAFNQLKDLIIEKGSYDAEDGSYTLILGSTTITDGSMTYYRGVIYSPEYNELDFILMLESDYMIGITIDELDGNYDWYYLDYEDDYMLGTISGATFTNHSTLTYSEHSLTNQADCIAVRDYATLMVQLLLTCMDDDLAPYGLTAENFGFINY